MTYDRKKIEMLKQRYPEGTRICVDRMENDPRPIPSGTKGTVSFVDDIGTVHCKFDNGRSLGLIPGEDSFYVIEQKTKQEVERKKPDCPLIGANGNIYNLAGIASKTLRDNGMAEQAEEMCSKITQSGSYDEALCVLSEYVNITSIDEEMEECEDYDEEQEIGMDMSY